MEETEKTFLGGGGNFFGKFFLRPMLLKFGQLGGFSGGRGVEHNGSGGSGSLHHGRSWWSL